MAGAVLPCVLLLCLALFPSPALAATSQELQAQLNEASTQLNGMIAETEEAMAALEETQRTIDETQTLIDDTIVRLDECAQEVERNKSELSAIISSDYKTRGSLGLLSFVLGASDYDDFVSRVYYVERITLQKERTLDDLRAAQEELAGVRQDLEEKSSELLDLATRQREQVNDLQDAVDAQQAYVDSLPAEIQAAMEAEYASALEASQKEAEALAENSAEGEEPPADDTEDEGADSQEEPPAPNDTNEDTTSSDETPDTPSAPSTPEAPAGGSLADVANYIGPQASWSSDASYIASQQRLLNAAGSGTSWGCVVDKGYGRCTVFRNDGGVWKAAMTTDVITNGHTFTGTFSVAFHARWYWQDGYDVNDWWVCFIEAWSRDNYSGHLRYVEGKGYDDGQGFHYGYSTGGCTVIPSMSTSQWLYDHVPDGSRVIVH